MSFTFNLKTELCKIQASTCCRVSECYGILLFGRAFSPDSIIFSTEHEEVVERLTMLLAKCFSVAPVISGGGTKRDYFTASIEGRDQRNSILTSLGYYGFHEGNALIKYQNIEDDCCKASFLRGAFLACGMVSDPNKEYHAEFLVQNHRLGRELFELLILMGLSPKITTRAKAAVVYFKESENIEDLLTTIGATSHTLQLAGVKVYKDMRNHYNRLSNCEMANLSKTINAAVEQRMAIKKLKQSGELLKLSAKLRQAANLREENPDASLQELCSIADPPITRSGLNHRLAKLVAISKTI